MAATRYEVRTYTDAYKVAEKCERLAREIAYDIRTLYYSTLEPSHCRGGNVDEECGIPLMESLKKQTEDLADWMETLEERIQDHRKHLDKEAK